MPSPTPAGRLPREQIMNAENAELPPDSDSRAPRFALLIVFLTVFIDLLGFGIVLPVLPRQAEPYLNAIGMPPLEGGAGGAVIGILFSVFSLMQFVFSPIWGRLSDRFGRRPILLLSLSGSVIFYALYGYAVSVPVDPQPTRDGAVLALSLILLARIGAGIAGASVGTAAAVIADCTTPENRARGMALIGIAFGGGFTLGPLIAYFGLAVFDEARWGVGAIASLLSGVALLLAIFVFRETRRPGAGASKEFPSVARSLAVLRMPMIGGLVLIYFLTIFAMAGFESTLALLTKAAFGMGDDANFLVFASIGFVLMLAGGGYRPLAKRLPERRLLGAGVLLMLLGLAAVGGIAWALSGREPDVVAASLWPSAFYAAASVAVCGFAFVNPSVSAIISRRADADRQGEVLGVNQSFASLARILGPMTGMTLFSLHPSHALPYAAAVAVLLLVAGLLPRTTGEPNASLTGHPG
ncbi:MAG: MFS transporter [Planctomycetia bacterium]|jgi:DHA1 family tetracycline resistance protein-like MFS transporter|nr:MFS transporter [Planctomycetia bacterium]